LLMKSTLNVEQQSAENPRANAMLRDHKSTRTLLGSRRTTVPSRDLLPVIQEPVLSVWDRRVGEKSNSNFGIEAEKGLTEHNKKRKKNDQPIDIRVKELQTKVVSSPFIPVRRVRSWASDGEDSDSDDDEEPRRIAAAATEQKTLPATPTITRLNTPVTPTIERCLMSEPGSLNNSSPVTPPAPLTPLRMEKRTRQIVIGKSTDGYKNYIRMVPREDRKQHHPTTPKESDPISKRAWDTKVRSWRRALHEWDGPDTVKSNQSFMSRSANRRKNKTPKRKSSLQTPAFLALQAKELSKADFPSLK